MTLRTVTCATGLTVLVATGACTKGKNTAPDARAEGKPTFEAAAPTGSARITGVVRFVGTPPPAEPWAGVTNADCKRGHAETTQLVNAQDGKLADVFVYVKSGLPAGTYPAPAAPVAFSQKGCEFEPRVFGVMAGQDLAVSNGDRLMHNVKSPEWNQGFPFGVERTLKLENEGVMVPIRCDVHPWMRAYAGVMTHPYFQVTKADGAFSLGGLVDGPYTVAAWHEKLGTVEQKTQTTAAAPATVVFELGAK